MIQDGLPAREIWRTRSRSIVSKTLASAITEAPSALCTVALPSGGIIYFNDSYSTVLSDSITFVASCQDPLLHGDQNTGNSTVVQFNDPFYASVAPQMYALATATMISYMLVILIFITPRTFYVGGPGGGAGFLGLRNIVPGSGSSNVIGVGRRPLLQKIAAVTVAISLTIATADTFHVANQQYDNGLMDSQSLVDDVIGSVEMRIVRVVSDTFLWLAQVQTLIRLFPRHKEKVTIKWLGFALVTCDTVFSILENFVSHTTLTRPRSFQDAIPAMSYLFQMAISLIYASCVIYYSLAKPRFAFWHPKMKNICLVATLSLISVLIPVVFFVLDVAQPNIASWGEYIQWVGAAAASVVVWEWVERIETLERDERKDGILGREIFDGDEMLDLNSDNKSSSTSNYFGFSKRTSSGDNQRVSMMPVSSMRPRIPFRRQRGVKQDAGKTRARGRPTAEVGGVHGSITRPLQVVTPISRSDTTSAASTVYAVRYQNVSSPSPALPEGAREEEAHTQVIGCIPPIPEAESSTLASNTRAEDIGNDEQDTQDTLRNRQVWQAVANPFKRKRSEPPAEVAAQMAVSDARRSPTKHYHNLRDRINGFRATQKAQLSGKQRPDPSPPLPVTVIPAQPRLSRVEASVVESRPSSPRRSLRPSLGRGSSQVSNSLRENLPVTVIPAPTRGGRTWSPADLRDDRQQPQDQSQPQPQPHSGSVGNEDTTHRAQGTPGSSEQNRSSVWVARGALTIAESPERAMEHESRNSSTSQRAQSRFRTPTIYSLHDRLSSTSLGSASARPIGSNSHGETRQRRSPIGTSGTGPQSHPPDLTAQISSAPSRPLSSEGRSQGNMSRQGIV